MATEKIELFKVFVSEDVMQPMLQTLRSGYLAQGPMVEKYETALCSALECQRLITVNAATSGLHLSLRLLRKEIRDSGYDGPINVLSTALTCTATNFPIPENGYGIKWVDVDPRNCNISLDDIKQKLSIDTRIIMVVHWSGYPIDLDALADIQDHCQNEFGFTPWIIQDCAHAFGMKLDGVFIHNHSRLRQSICVYSTQAIKHLTTSDGGFIVLPTDELFRRGKLLRWYGIDRNGPKNAKDYRIEQDVPEAGFKFHLNDVAACIGLYNLPHVFHHIEYARKTAQYYANHINNPMVTLLDYAKPQDASWWIYTIRVKEKDRFIQYMLDNNIVTSQVHKRNDGHSCLAQFASKLPKLDWFEKEMVCIPIGWWVSEDNIKHIVACVNKFQ